MIVLKLKNWFLFLSVLTVVPFAQAEPPIRDPDNTSVNQRDQAQTEVTAESQKNNEVDVGITQRIRQDLVKDDSLSTNAKNIKVITVDRVVTLKGPVASTAEKQKVVRIAKNVAGEDNVTDQIDVLKK